MNPTDIIKTGDYIVIQRQDYFKLHRISENGTVNFGRDVVDIGNVIGKPVWTTYRLVQKKNGKRNYQLAECNIEDLKNESIVLSNMNPISSGADNRNIVDDGSSQKLSMEEIVELRNEGLSSKKIVGTLVENSKTFHNKTEYSQQKYLKKKEKKYFEYITIRKPSIRLIADIMFRLDQGKIMGLRIDTLSQIITAVNLHSHGTYILYESGCQGLTAAALINGLCGEGRLVLAHPGNFPSKQAVLALNLDKEQEDCLISVNIYNLLRRVQTVKSCHEHVSQEENGNLKNGTSAECPLEASQEEDKYVETSTVDSTHLKEEDSSSVDNPLNLSSSDANDQVNSDPESSGSGKRKHSESGISGTTPKKSRNLERECLQVSQGETSHTEASSLDLTLVNKGDPSSEENADKADSTLHSDTTDQSQIKSHQENSESDRLTLNEGSVPKKSRWEVEVDRAEQALSSKADGLVLVCRENPSSILNALLPYVAPSRNFVVYGQHREPLQDLHMQLYKRKDIINLRLTDSWLRYYQVESERTHPLVNMTGSGGYLLTGVVVDCSGR